VQAASLGGIEDVVDISKVIPFKEVIDTIKSIAQDVRTSITSAHPHKASVEFGIEVGIESGALSALLVKGTSTGNLKVTLEWTSEQASEGRASAEDGV
jgi:hypothetical protein